MDSQYVYCMCTDYKMDEMNGCTNNQDRLVDIKTDGWWMYRQTYEGQMGEQI